MIENGLPVRHLEDDGEASAYTTTIECTPVASFSGPVVVNMRPIPYNLVVKAVQVTSCYPVAHGVPVHIGATALIGIHDLAKVDFGEPVRIVPSDIPLFWGCGITPQVVAENANSEFMISHYTNHMFIADVSDEDIAVL